MKKPMTFSISPVATAVSLVLTAGLAFPVYAQDQGQDNEEKAKEESIEVINVSGIRGSLARSTDFKRQSSGVVDAISAEEMGKFPDTNLAESLQRITGVSVSRTSMAGKCQVLALVVLTIWKPFRLRELQHLKCIKLHGLIHPVVV